MNASWVSDLINLLPYYVSYIAPGFLLISLFAWTSSIQIKSGTSLIITSLVASYIIWALSSKETVSISIKDAIIVSAVSALVGIVSAIVVKASWFNSLLARLGIKRTTNTSIWDDVIGKKAWIAIRDKKEDIYYCGQFQYHFAGNNNSYLVIAAYYVADLNGKTIKDRDYTGDLSRKLMIHEDHFDTIIVSANDPFGNYEL